MKRISVCLCAAALLACFSVRAADSDKKDSEGWIKLFDGQSLKGWKANERADNWKVEDGKIVATGERSHLFYVGDDEKKPAEFTDFDFKAEVMTTPGSNSGIYFHTKWQNDGWPENGYEAQVNQTHTDPVKTGSLYNVVKNLQAPAKDNEWYTEEIIVKGKHITIKANGKTIVDYEEDPKDIQGNRKLSKGTFALQAHDPKSKTYYRNIMVKPL